MKSAAKEYRRVLNETNLNWKPGAYRATKFKKEEAKRYIEHLEDDNSLYVRAYKDHYIIMKVIGSGLVLYYAEQD
jgi:hypothetical protein